MTLELHLSPELEARLRERAAAAGKDIEGFALHALKEKLQGPRTFAEILAPVHKAVRESGMTDAELDAFLEKAIADSRQERRNRAL